MTKFKGNLIIISGPSRIGKDVVVKKILQYHQPQLTGVVTYTTRPKRIGEKNGREHIFITEKTFRKMIHDKKFLEWKWYANQRYGTPKNEIIKKLLIGKNILLNIEVKGASKVKKQLPDTLRIFITAESKREIKRRIFNSDKLTRQQKNIRWHNAIKELEASKQYDYIVINRWGKLEQTIKQVKKIIVQYIN